MIKFILKNINKNNIVISFFVFTFILVVTFFVYFYSVKNAKDVATLQFNGITEKANLSITKQMLGYTQVMLAAKSLYYTQNNKISHAQWKIFTQNLYLQKNYPGIQGFGFNQRVLHKEKNLHIEKVKSLGFPNYEIRPSGIRDEYFPVLYLEPFNERNKRAFGFDVYAEPIRHIAIDSARDNGLAQRTGKIKLVQETSSDVQNGFLVFMPLYSSLSELIGIEERKKNFIGCISAVFRMNDLMYGIFQNNYENYNLKIYDGRLKSEDNLLYNSSNQVNEKNSLFLNNYIENVNNREWTLEFSSTKYFENNSINEKPIILLISGIIFSFLMSIIILATLSLKDQTIALYKSNDDLKNTQAQLIQSAKFAALGEMAGEVAHEINNPLTVISGKAYKLIKMSRKGNLDIAAVEENANIIEDIVRHISKITRGFLAYSRDSDVNDLSEEYLYKIIDQATTLCDEKFKNNGVELKIENLNLELKINCSMVQISQVILNLLNNSYDAVKYLEKNGLKLIFKRTQKT